MTVVARDIMATHVVTVQETATARQVAEVLLGSPYDAVPVVDENRRLVGMVSYVELIRLALPDFLDKVDLSFLPPSAGFFPRSDDTQIGDVLVSEFMRRGQLPQVCPEEPVAEVARIMVHEDVRRVVVVEDCQVIGIISSGDVVRAIVSPRM